MRILLIEDNKAIAEIVQRSLTISASLNRIITLECAACGLDGLRLARANAFDAYLIDLDLPDIHGLQVGPALVFAANSCRWMPRARSKPQQHWNRDSLSYSKPSVSRIWRSNSNRYSPVNAS